VMAPAFTPRNVPLMAQHIIRSTEAACERLQRLEGVEGDMLLEMQMLSLEGAATTLFSLEAATFAPELRRLLTQYRKRLGRIHLSDALLPDSVPTLLSIRRAVFRRRWMSFIRSTMEVRRSAEQTGTPRDLFDLLSQAHGAGDQDLLADEVSTMI